ncbi:hypothetical protein Tco_0268743 [Tanacetum coccineum]
MTISLDLPKQTLNAQTEARKPENIKNEDVGGQGEHPDNRFVGTTRDASWKWDNITMDFVMKLPKSSQGYHASIKAAPFEALYGRKCRSPVGWAEVGKVQLTGPDIVQGDDTEIIHVKKG